MKARLMYRDRDFIPDKERISASGELIADLELKPVISAMAGSSSLISEVCTAALVSPLQDISEIEYRQAVLLDCLEHPKVLRRLCDICTETESRRRSSWYMLSSRWLTSTFSSAVELLKLYTDMLKELRDAADRNAECFKSEGFRNFFAMLRRELPDEYFAEISRLLSELRDGSGALVSARFGIYVQGVSYVMRRKNKSGFRRRWFFAPMYTVPERDDAGASDLLKRRERAINESANALAQAAEHLEGFFAMLRTELAFYAGCLNLSEKMQELGLPMSVPEILPVSGQKREWKGLCDLSLALIKNSRVVSNELSSDGKRLYIITGANQGGKTTFLRSMGQAQLMAQSGMFVCAEKFTAPMRLKVFTHFKKEEDSSMRSGKLDEELSRMSGIAGQLCPGCMILFNESFASTNEREGSMIMGQICRALAENGIEIFSVTHLYSYASAFLECPYVFYLRAQRLENGERSFRILPGKPLETAFGEDLYKKIFG